MHIDFHGLTDVAPPSYDDIFGNVTSIPPGNLTSIPPHTIVNHPPPLARPVVAPVRIHEIPASLPIDNGDGDNWCLSSVNKSPLKTGKV